MHTTPTPLRRRRAVAAALLLAIAVIAAPAAQAAQQTFSENEILGAAENFFGLTSKGLADVVQKVFADLGEPTGYVAGEEISGAFFFGLRYGQGELTMKGRPATEVHWQGPSIGFDFGGNASKTFALVYGLPNPAALWGRYPGIDGSVYVVAGIGVNYQGDGTVTLAPIRTGVGLRFGANLGYLNYSPDGSIIPF